MLTTPQTIEILGDISGTEKLTDVFNSISGSNVALTSSKSTLESQQL